MNRYVSEAFKIITEEYNEELGIRKGEKLCDVDKEIIWEIKDRLKEPPTAVLSE
ncbi:hypothetical protein PthstB1num2_33510 [Parageobacillus thermoglucosidasius]|nr:hypothetical protein PthstB1num2_33510 [Parageobacillus thermoglucosidasius]